MEIKLIFGHTVLEAELDSSALSNDITKLLPLETEVNRWGGEIYFVLPEMLDYSGETDEVEIGDVAFWPNGPALCLFFGETPGSFTNKPRPHSISVVIGKIKGIQSKVPELMKIANGTKVRIEKS